jgi:hypothetical protein
MEIYVFGAGWSPDSLLQADRVQKTIQKGYDIEYKFFDIDDLSNYLYKEKLAVRTIPTTIVVDHIGDDIVMVDRIVGVMEEFQIDNLFFDVLGVKL